MKHDSQLILNFKTWNSENSSIFNYQNEKIIDRDEKTIEKNIYLCRDDNNEVDNDNYNNIVVEKYHEGINRNFILLFRARKNKENNYEIINVVRKKMEKTPDNINKLDNKMWLVMPSMGEELYANYNKPYYLLENDIIKVGRMKYEVIKMNIPIAENNNKEDENIVNSINKKFGPIFNDIILKNEQYCQEITELKSQKSINNDSFKSMDSNSSDNVGFEENKDCRICFTSISTKDNPKLKICNCHTYIHYECLKKFLKTNIEIYENLCNTVTSYKCSKFNCEICEQPFPLIFKIKYSENDIKTYYLIDGLELPEDTNYIILESLTHIKEKKNIKNIFVMKLINENLSFGRKEDNDLIDGDISISRRHAIFKFDKENGVVTIVNQSKFGVLILIKNNLKLTNCEKINFQVGRTYITAEQEEI